MRIECYIHTYINRRGDTNTAKQIIRQNRWVLVLLHNSYFEEEKTEKHGTVQIPNKEAG